MSYMRKILFILILLLIVGCEGQSGKVDQGQEGQGDEITEPETPPETTPEPPVVPKPNDAQKKKQLLLNILE